MTEVRVLIIRRHDFAFIFGADTTGVSSVLIN